MDQQPVMDESTNSAQPKHTGLWIALGIGGGLIIVGVIVGVVLLVLHLAPARGDAAKTPNVFSEAVVRALDDERQADARIVVNAIASYQAEYGVWLAEPNDVREALRQYTTVKVNKAALTRLTSDMVSREHQERITLRACKDDGGVVTGMTVYTWRAESHRAVSFSTGGCPTE